MTACIARFEPPTRTLTLSNAGHIYPYLVTPDGTREWKVPGPMLGKVTRSAFTAQRQVLGPTDWVFFCTDGLVEALDPEGEPIGYARMQAAIPGFHRPRAADTIRESFAWFDGVSRRPTPDDDITVVVLQPTRRDAGR
jgi:serine phosphatase RsbU (regulator of sigma subunit)